MHVYFLGVVLFHFIQIGISHATSFDVQKDAMGESLPWTVISEPNIPLPRYY